MTTRTADSKGRISLGERFANRTVIVQEVDETEVRVTLARVIPEREAWLYDSEKAKASVKRGLGEARRGRLSSGPDLAAARKIAARIKDDE